MHVYVDADACPVVAIVTELCRERSILLTLLCDTNHILRSEYADVRTVSAGNDAVDLALINLARRGDLVVTQDYGVAAMALGRGCFAIHQSGMVYTDENIDRLLMERHVAKKSRMAHGKHHLHGPSKRNDADDKRFRDAFINLLENALAQEGS